MGAEDERSHYCYFYLLLFFWHLKPTLFITCSYATSFWLDFICWCKKINIDLEELSNTDILLGIWQRKDDFLLLNHLVILAKQYIYDCRQKGTHPSFRIFTNKINYVYRLEWQITRSNKNESSHKLKWKKYRLYALDTL